MSLDDADDSLEDSIRIDRRKPQHDHAWELFQLLEQVPVGVFVATGTGRPYYANARARSLLGMGAVPDHVDQFSEAYQAFEIGTDRLYPIERLPLRRALAGERCEVSDIELRHPTGPIPLHVSGAPIKRGGEIAFAIMALQNVHELRRLATQDALTGLPNRMAIQEGFARERLRAERGRHPIAIALIDFDHFKSINDDFGHPVGDGVLRRGSAAIVEAMRPTDLVGRWGGEELLVVLPDTRLEPARLAVERALIAVRGLHIPAGGTRVHATFSAGVVELAGNEALDELVKRADVALYEAKRAGRDRVVAAAAGR